MKGIGILASLIGVAVVALALHSSFSSSCGQDAGAGANASPPVGTTTPEPDAAIADQILLFLLSANPAGGAAGEAQEEELRPLIAQLTPDAIVTGGAPEPVGGIAELPKPTTGTC